MRATKLSAWELLLRAKGLLSHYVSETEPRGSQEDAENGEVEDITGMGQVFPELPSR